jgi:hypothetical protein
MERSEKGSIAGDEYLNDVEQARVDDHGVASWVETCFCDSALAEERPTGKRISTMRTPVGIASMRTEQSRGLAVIVVTRRNSRSGSRLKAKRLSKRFAQAKAISRSPRRTRDRRSLFTTLLALVWSFDIRIL